MYFVSIFNFDLHFNNVYNFTNECVIMSIVLDGFTEECNKWGVGSICTRILFLSHKF